MKTKKLTKSLAALPRNASKLQFLDGAWRAPSSCEKFVVENRFFWEISEYTLGPPSWGFPLNTQ